MFFVVTYDGTRPTGNARFAIGSPGQVALPDSDATHASRADLFAGSTPPCFRLNSPSRERRLPANEKAKTYQ